MYLGPPPKCSTCHPLILLGTEWINTTLVGCTSITLTSCVPANSFSIPESDLYGSDKKVGLSLVTSIICFPPLPSIVLIHRLTASSKNWHHVKIHYIEEQFNHRLSHWNHHQGKREPHVIQQRLSIICSQSKVPEYKRDCGTKAPSKVGGHSFLIAAVDVHTQAGIAAATV